MSPELSDYEYQEEEQNLKKKPNQVCLSARESQRSEQLQQRKLRVSSSKQLVSIGQLSLNSVTDKSYIAAYRESDNDKAIKKQMIRYLSRVSDRNKPLFMFNQKFKMGSS
jgi:hypothetical protein